MTDERPTIPVPPAESATPYSRPASHFSRMSCGVPGHLDMTAREYGLAIVAQTRAGNFGTAGDLIEAARNADMLGVIRAAYTGTP
jgi:hypothetical protein